MNDDILRAERMHLAGLLEAIQQCVYFLRDRDMKLPRNLDTLRHDANACHPSARAIQAGYLVARFDGYRLHFFRAVASPESPIRNIRSYL